LAKAVITGVGMLPTSQSSSNIPSPFQEDLKPNYVTMTNGRLQKENSEVLSVVIV